MPSCIECKHSLRSSRSGYNGLCKRYGIPHLVNQSANKGGKCLHFEASPDAKYEISMMQEEQHRRAIIRKFGVTAFMTPHEALEYLKKHEHW